MGVYFFADISREAMNLLAEMRQGGYPVIATDATKEPWTQIQVPRFRVVGECEIPCFRKVVSSLDF